MIKVLAIGDTYGEPGRRAIERFVPAMKKSGEVDFVLCNAENSADGAGITEKIARQLFDLGCDVLTLGDHAFDKKKDIESMMGTDIRLVRPANFPKGTPGVGSTVVECRGTMIGVIHVAGQVFMRFHFSSPFTCVDEEILKLQARGARMILVDMHAEATSEKMAMSWYLDGRVAAVVGTHTHIQTADERVSEKKTACISDLGMTGPYDSVIGAEKEAIIKRFLTQVGGKKEVAQNDARLSGAIIHVDEKTGLATHIERVHRKIG